MNLSTSILAAIYNTLATFGHLQLDPKTSKNGFHNASSIAEPQYQKCIITLTQIDWAYCPQRNHLGPQIPPKIHPWLPIGPQSEPKVPPKWPLSSQINEKPIKSLQERHQNDQNLRKNTTTIPTLNPRNNWHKVFEAFELNMEPNPGD